MLVGPGRGEGAKQSEAQSSQGQSGHTHHGLLSACPLTVPPPIHRRHQLIGGQDKTPGKGGHTGQEPASNWFAGWCWRPPPIVHRFGLFSSFSSSSRNYYQLMYATKLCSQSIALFPEVN